MKPMKKVARIFDGLLDVFAFLATALLAFVMLLIIAEISRRSIWGRPIEGTVEITGYGLLYITFLAAAWGLKEEAHVSVDLVFDQLRPKVQSVLRITTSFISAIVFLVVTWYGIMATWHSFQLSYAAATELATPRFIIVLIIPIGSSLLSIQCLRRAYGFLKRGARGEKQHW